MASRRGSGEGSIYRRSRDGKWCAVLDLGYVNGKRKRRTRTADTRAEAARLLKIMQAEVDAGAVDVDPRTPLTRWANRWLEHDVGYRLSVGRLRPATAESYERLVRCHVIPHIGHEKLVELDSQKLQRAYADMLAGGLSPSSVSKVHQVVRSMLDAAVRDRVLVVNPCHRVSPPAVPRTEVEPLTIDELAAIFQYSEGTFDYCLWTVMAFCGLRLGEALALRWSDIDLDDRVLRVDRTLGQHAYGIRFGPPKSDKGRRRIPLVDEVVETIGSHRKLVVKRRLAARRWDDECDALFPSQVGTWQYPRNVQRRFRTMRERLGLPEYVRPHTLRHTYASLLFDAGVELPVVQELLGHADLATTRLIYVHLTERIKREAADLLEARLHERSPGGSKR